jgi:hypothetical protein
VEQIERAKPFAALHVKGSPLVLYKGYGNDLEISTPGWAVPLRHLFPGMLSFDVSGGIPLLPALIKSAYPRLEQATHIRCLTPGG